MNRSLFFKYILLVTKESYLQLLTAGIVFMYVPKELQDYIKEVAPVQARFDVFISYTFLIVCLGFFPLAGILILVHKPKTLNRTKHMLRWGELWEFTQVEKKVHRVYPLLFILRRIYLVLIALVITRTVGIQLILLMYMNLANLLYIGISRPLVTDKMNNMLPSQEFVVIFVTV